jgi:hypothetical protein
MLERDGQDISLAHNNTRSDFLAWAGELMVGGKASKEKVDLRSEFQRMRRRHAHRTIDLLCKYDEDK